MDSRRSDLGGQGSQRKDERGHAMAVLLVAIAIMMTFMSVALPVWSQQARREKEEELLFRLTQYAHAIALYQRQFPGAQPPTIDVLVEQRFLRRKFKDPMTGEDFAVLRMGQVSTGMTTPMPGMTVPQGGAGGMLPGGSQAKGSAPSTSGGRSGPGLGPGTIGGEQGGRPIRGVVSTSTETSLRVWKGRTRYDQWEVTPEDIVPRFFGPNPNDGLQPGQPQPGMGGARGPMGSGGGSSGPVGSQPQRPRR